MRRCHLATGAVPWVWSAAVLVVMCATACIAAAQSGWVNPLTQRTVTGPPLKICDQGAFFVGGVPKITNYANSSTAGPPQQITIGQAYVQFQIPEKRRRWPLIMLHGSSHTGAALDVTPDGREGWLAYAVRNHLATFVMDQPGRGRSGFDESVIHEAKGTGNLDLIPNIGRITDDGSWTTWFGHIIPADTDLITGLMTPHGNPGDDPQRPQDPNNPSEGHGNYPPAFPIPPVPNSIDKNIQARNGAIGPAPNPANNTFLALSYYKQLVPNAEATLPGLHLPYLRADGGLASQYLESRALAELVEGLGGAIVSPHSQSTIQAMHMVRILKEHGKLDLLKGIIMPEGAAPLASAGLVPSDFDHIPFLLVNGDYRPLATPVSGRLANRADVAAMNASPTRTVGPALAIDLDDPRFRGRFNGTTHMNMLGTTNLAVFDFLLEWASTNIPNPYMAGGCGDKKEKEKK